MKIGEFARGKADILLTIGKFKECFKEGFKEGTMVFETKQELMEKLADLIEADSTILVKASRSEKFEEIIKYIEEVK
jgi:UDP-N-acetylmuramoyl-tripeptide--D-alanyl-D-alanine ligase